MIEVRCMRGGTATAVWGPRVAVLAHLRSTEALPAELAALVARPNVGAADVLDLLVAGGGQRVGDFGIAEELDDGSFRVVLRGQGSCGIAGVLLQGRGMWRSRVVSADQIDLYDSTAPPDSGEAVGDQQEVAPVLASSLTVRVAGRPGRAATSSTPCRPARSCSA